MAADKVVDILIVGGGGIGVALLLALEQMGYHTLLLEKKPFNNALPADFDARSFALSPASVRILEQLNAAPAVMTPIQRIHVSERGQFGSARLESKPGEPLGVVVEAHHLYHAMQQRVDATHIMAPATLIHFDPTSRIATVQSDQEQIRIQVGLLVAADGADSSVRAYCGLQARVKSYTQAAVVANIGLARSHHNQAFERFTPSGPIALLPMTDSRAALVWTLPLKEVDRVMQWTNQAFLSGLQQAFGYRLGRFIKAGQRVAYPLRQVRMPTQIAWPVVFIGNAAHTLHPVAGQGFNLGLRDVAMLAQCIRQQGLIKGMLVDYQQARQHDQRVIMRFTDGLIDLFTSQVPGLGGLRGAGLAALDTFPAAKTLLTRYAGGFGGIVPDMVCGIPLSMDVQ